MNTCVACDSIQVSETIQNEEFGYGAPTPVMLYASVPVLSCAACNMMWTDSRAEDIRARVINVYTENKAKVDRCRVEQILGSQPSSIPTVKCKECDTPSVSFALCAHHLAAEYTKHYSILFLMVPPELRPRIVPGSFKFEGNVIRAEISVPATFITHEFTVTEPCSAIPGFTNKEAIMDTRSGEIYPTLEAALKDAKDKDDVVEITATEASDLKKLTLSDRMHMFYGLNRAERRAKLKGMKSK